MWMTFHEVNYNMMKRISPSEYILIYCNDYINLQKYNIIKLPFFIYTLDYNYIYYYKFVHFGKDYNVICIFKHMRIL